MCHFKKKAQRFAYSLEEAPKTQYLLSGRLLQKSGQLVEITNQGQALQEHERKENKKNFKKGWFENQKARTRSLH
ncbi:hypothetical protein RO3G_12737 [Rhizopus delemar RA 99-880]|uniref:Uncharacterized protein n=1 Tax=Rhizopus delemar (strain RA 99-880 / ATCC MYA-4621 / FGSC 9543 / NRRL 43880) TaxID=246409 RepID=I1CHU6_RHIO9|nr:hypothetical protein RO3G_12737 [Rhizopus delemar RA 99-880]|eukprot:EIE88026.1 hypothetical protein RO3G_12737 [Rhizopus delemar RA 99-880]